MKGKEGGFRTRELDKVCGKREVRKCRESLIYGLSIAMAEIQ